MTDGPPFSILQWNARGLKSHLNELKDYISQPGNYFDLLCLQETHLKSAQNLDLLGYEAVRADRTDQKGGGVATFIKKGYRTLN